MREGTPPTTFHEAEQVRHDLVHLVSRLMTIPPSDREVEWLVSEMLKVLGVVPLMVMLFRAEFRKRELEMPEMLIVGENQFFEISRAKEARLHDRVEWLRDELQRAELEWQTYQRGADMVKGK